MYGHGHLSILDKDRCRDAFELVAAVETRNLENEEETNNMALELLDKIGSCLGGTTCEAVRLCSETFFFGAERFGVAYQWR